MVNRPKEKGTWAESEVAKYLKQTWWPEAERRALNGSTDRGDITGVPRLAFEVKYAGGEIQLAEWLKETRVERVNAEADHGILVIKPPGVGDKNIERWIAAMHQDDFLRLQSKVLATSPGVIFAMAEPTHYVESTLRATLSARVQAAGDDPQRPAVLTLRPRKLRDNPDLWYQVLQFGQMVEVLHAAGYGEGPRTPG